MARWILSFSAVVVAGAALGVSGLACSAESEETSAPLAASAAPPRRAATTDVDADVTEPTSSDDDGNGTDGGPSPPPHAFDIGMCGQANELAAFRLFREASPSPPSELRLCHTYTYWDVAHHDPPGATRTHTLAGLRAWLDAAVDTCDEAMITFQGEPSLSESPPSTADFEAAFVAFSQLTAPGQPLEKWHGKLSFTAWNEPNNKNPSGSGLAAPLSPEQAAQYYLAARKHCGPETECKVAAGDFATNGNLGQDLQWNCADDNDPANTTTRCAHASSYNPNNKLAPSYLDRYKNYIANNATKFGLPAQFRPEYLAYHPWHDVNAYIESNLACTSYQDCATRRLLTSLGGTWSGTEIWDNEIGVGLQTRPAPDATTTQPCGAAFLMQLTNLSPRVKRLYYMWMGSGNGPLFDGTKIRAAGTILASRATTYGETKCAPTGM